jgi:hypothetical protein
VLRIGVVRWIVAEAIPFACVFIGALIGKLGTAGSVIGVLLALFGGTILTIYYLYKVVGASAGWAIPLVLLLLPSTILGTIIFGHYTVTDAQHPNGTHLVVTGTYWAVWGVLLGAVAIVVTLAVVTGERWRRRHPAGTRPSRGSLAPSR